MMFIFLNYHSMLVSLRILMIKYVSTQDLSFTTQGIIQKEQQKTEERYWEVPFSVQDCVKDENGIAGPEPEELSGLRKIECPSCGKEVSAKAIDCPHCGGSINARAEGVKWGDAASIFVAAFFLIPILVQFFRGL